MFDLIILGAGTAGLTASIYASRFKINHLILGEIPGGQGLDAGLIENYPGFISITGSELMSNFVKHAQSYGVQIVQKQIDKLTPIEGGFELAAEGEKWQAKTLILAMGASWRRLGIPGEKEFVGRGVSFCTTCDSPLFKDKEVAVVGGGNAALKGAVHLAGFASKIYLIHRRDQYKAEPIWVDKIKQVAKIEQILSNEIVEIKGNQVVTEVVLKMPYKDSTSLKVGGVFIEAGHVPTSSLAKQLGVVLGENDYIQVSPDMATSVRGVFAAGDLASVPGEVSCSQIVTAAADGARAATAVYQYLHGELPINPCWLKKA